MVKVGKVEAPVKMRSLVNYHPRILGTIGIFMICLLIKENSEKTPENPTSIRSRRDVYENTYWQLTNYTAKMITNESCYVCMMLHTSASKHTMIPMKINGSELKATAQYCKSEFTRLPMV